MHSAKIDVDKLAETVMSDLTDYVNTVNKGTSTAIEDTAEELANDINRRAPRMTGKYSTTWTHRENWKRGNIIGQIVYSQAPGYRLAHLLENGHDIKRGGAIVGRANAIPHIKPATEDAEKSLVNRIKGEIE